MNYEKLIELIPDYQGFFTVDQLNQNSLALAEKYPEKVKVYQAGTSRNNQPIYVLKIGNGAKNALLFGCPHPNEPIGAMMLDFFSERLAEDDELLTSLDYTWYLIKVIDIDGTKLNEGWFKDSNSIRSYAEGFYRPPGHQQVEWTFPVDYKTLRFNKPLPETKILMDLIDEIKPTFMYSLHNCGFGGVYYYISKEVPELYQKLTDLPEKLDLPLALGEPEAPFLEKLAPAIYRLFGMAKQYNYLEENLTKDRDPADVIKAGTSSDDYANQVANTYTLVCEMPYYYDSRINNLSETLITRKEALIKSNQRASEQLEFAQKIYKQIKKEITNNNSPFLMSIENYLETIPDQLQATRNWIENDPSLSRKATVAEEFDNKIVGQFYNLLMLGMFKRLIKEIRTEKPDNEQLKRAKEELERKFEEIIGYLEENLDYTAIPIKNLIAVQLLAGLYIAEYLDQGEKQ